MTAVCDQDPPYLSVLVEASEAAAAELSEAAAFW